MEFDMQFKYINLKVRPKYFCSITERTKRCLNALVMCRITYWKIKDDVFKKKKRSLVLMVMTRTLDPDVQEPLRDVNPPVKVLYFSSGETLSEEEEAAQHQLHQAPGASDTVSIGDALNIHVFSGSYEDNQRFFYMSLFREAGHGRIILGFGEHRFWESPCYVRNTTDGHSQV